MRVVVEEVHVLHFEVLAHTLYLLLPHVFSLLPFVGLGKFGNPSGGDPTVSFHHCRRRSASGMAHSANLRVTHCVALGTSAECFAYWNSVHLCDYCVGHCSFDSHRDDFLHCFLGSQPLFGWDRHIPQSCGNVVYFGCCFYYDLLRVTSTVYYEQHPLCQPTNSLFP